MLAVVFATGLGGAGATLAAAFARTTEAATTVALPLLAGLLGEGIWATLVPLGEVAWRMRATGWRGAHRDRTHRLAGTSRRRRDSPPGQRARTQRVVLLV